LVLNTRYDLTIPTSKILKIKVRRPYTPCPLFFSFGCDARLNALLVLFI